MHTSLRLLLVMLAAVWAGSPLLAATTSTSKKKSASAETPAKKSSPAKSDATPAKKTTPAEPVNEDPATSVPTQAAVSTISVEDIRDFDKYPKQIQSLVQSSMALTRLELGYLYGSHEPSKGGMDCSGTIYHVLHFQGLKGVPRQSDEMCQWVDKKSQLHLTPTATSFDSDEFANLKPGDLLFWTNTTKTARKLPVTHVMIYLGKLKKSGRRVVFGSSDGRSFHGERRSGVSVFDFSLPREGSTSRFYGYGPTPGLMPPEPKPAEPERPVIATVTPAPAAAAKETPAPKEPAGVKAAPASKTSVALKESTEPKKTPAVKEEQPPAPKEEVRKAIAFNTDEATAKADTATSADSEAKTEVKKTVAATDTPAKASSSTPSKARTTATKKKTSSNVSTTRRRRTPPAPQKSVIEQKIDRAVSSVRRFFQQ